MQVYSSANDKDILTDFIPGDKSNEEQAADYSQSKTQISNEDAMPLINSFSSNSIEYFQHEIEFVRWGEIYVQIAISKNINQNNSPNSPRSKLTETFSVDRATVVIWPETLRVSLKAGSLGSTSGYCRCTD